MFRLNLSKSDQIKALSRPQISATDNQHARIDFNSNY